MDELAQATGMDPIDFRLGNAAREGDPRRLWAEVRSGGALFKTLEAAKDSEHYRIPLGPNQGRGVASGFWFNIGG